MKKVMALAAAVLAGTALISFAGCGQDGSSAGLGGGAGDRAEAGVKDAYALGAVTTAGLLSAVGVQPADAGAEGQTAGEEAPKDGTQSDALSEEVGEFQKYFGMLEGFLDEDVLRTTITQNTDTSYDFEYRLTVEGKLLDGESAACTMYYSETLVTSREERDGDETESSVAYSLEGVLEMNGVLYEMEGFRSSETETERGEEERSEQLWIMAADPADPSSRVRMDLETETEAERGEQGSEREYVYSVYGGGELLERTSLSFEQEEEDGERETEYELSILKDGVRSVFEVERAQSANGTVTVGVRYSTADGRGRFVLTRTADGTYRCVFGDGSLLEFGQIFG